MNTAENLINSIKEIVDPDRAQHSQRFFKTGVGEYGENDVFVGLSVPQQRQIAKTYFDLPNNELSKLLKSEIHECRLTALFILVHAYKKASTNNKSELYKFYLDHLYAVNNWDLVDSSAHYIVGEYLVEHPDKRGILYSLAQSDNLWEKRISIIATAAFIKQNDFTDTLKISEILLNDSHDLIHKAVGWMLREVGKKDLSAEEAFLDKHASVMPRTMLRYAIEKFDESSRQNYLKQGRENNKDV